MSELGVSLSEIADIPVTKERIPLAELPEFNGGSFKLHYFPEGVKLVTRKSQLRREGLPPTVESSFPSERIRQLNEKERTFGEKRGLNLLRSLGFKARDEDPALKPAFSPRVNLHDIAYEEVDGKPVLSYDIRPTTFAMASDKEILSNPQFAEQFSFTGSAIALVTSEKDGSSNTVLGYRLAKNANYPSMAGAAAAGVPSGKFEAKETRTHDDRGRLLPADNNFFTRGLLEELHEEINLQSEDLVGGEPQPIALIWDNVQPHREIGFMGKFKGSTEDLVAKAAENEQSGNKDLDFAEEFIVMKGGIEPLRRFLTESLSPQPPTHAGLYTSLLIQMMSEKYPIGTEEFDTEITTLQEEMQQHTVKINQTVADFYKANPEKAAFAREKGYNTEAYDYRVGVVEQGLNDPRTWLKENNLFVI